ncbi:hypothetical protein D3C81_1646400 [compost metagenome]
MQLTATPVADRGVEGARETGNSGYIGKVRLQLGDFIENVSVIPVAAVQRVQTYTAVENVIPRQPEDAVGLTCPEQFIAVRCACHHGHV